MPETKPILVTGPTGIIGQAVVKQLSAQGVPVRAFLRQPHKAAAIQSPGVEIVAGDLDDAASIESALTGVRAALLLTQTTPRRVPQEAAFIAAAQKTHLAHLVKISILGANTTSACRILRWHGETEKLLTDSGLSFTLLRPHYFMQNLFWSLTDIQQRGVFLSSLPATTAHSHIDARDIAAVAATVLTEAGHAAQVYQLTGPQALTYPQVAESLSQTLGRPIHYDPSPQHYADQLSGFGMDAQAVQDVLDLDTCVVKGEGVGDEITDVVSRVTGRAPITIEKFIEDYADRFARA